MPRPRARLALPVTLTLAALASGGCGGGDGADESVVSPVRITVSEYRIEPDDITVRTGGERPVTFIVRDAGRLTHNITVEVPRERGDNAPDEGQGAEVLGRTPTAHEGETVRDAFRLPPGEYRLRCSIANHDDLGMEGTLRVEGPRGG